MLEDVSLHRKWHLNPKYEQNGGNQEKGETPDDYWLVYSVDIFYVPIDSITTNFDHRFNELFSKLIQTFLV
jgi:hypothetical protein